MQFPRACSLLLELARALVRQNNVHITFVDRGPAVHDVAALQCACLYLVLSPAGLLVCDRPTHGIRLHAAKLLAFPFIPATIFVALTTGLFSRGSTAHVIHLKPGWLQEDDGFVEFWFGNFGILPLCTAALVLLIFWKIEFRPGSGRRSAVVSFEGPVSNH